MLPPYTWLAPWLARAEFGDVATWIGSTANVATLGLALAAGILSFRIYKIESGRDQRAEGERRERTADERRSQANLVSVWYGQATGDAYTEWGGKLGTMKVKIWAAHILNASNLPIYDVEVSFITGKPGVRPFFTKSIRVVPPHQDPRVVGIPRSIEGELGERISSAVNVSLKFRDTAGRTWMRDEAGYLHEIQPRSIRTALED